MKNFILILILIFAFGIRVYKIETNPAGFFCDEALRGVDAYSLLKTGRDSNGDFWPLFFKGFNFDAVSPYHVYGTFPFIAIFGLKENSVRLAAVFWSLVEIIFFYFLLKEFLPIRFSLIGAFLLSISPWHFHLGRVNLGDFYSWTLLTILAYLFLTKSLKTGKTRFFIFSAVFFGLTTYSYYPARLTTPLFFGLIFLLLLRKKYIKQAIILLAIYSLVILPFVRFHLTETRSFQRLEATVGTKINFSSQEWLTRFFHKYLLHYSDTFLFTKGDADFPGQLIKRHSISGLGLFYPYQRWLTVAGFIWIIVEIAKKKKIELVFTLLLLFLFPLADSLTSDNTPFATRSYLGILPFSLLISFGVYAVYQVLKSYNFWENKLVKISVGSTFFLLVVSSSYILAVKFVNSPLTTFDFWGWQYGPREIIGYFKEVEKNYDELFMEPVFNAGHIFFKFYASDNCHNCYLGNLKNYDPTKKQLFALSVEYLRANPNLKYLTKKIIFYPNKKEAFRIIEVIRK